MGYGYGYCCCCECQRLETEWPMVGEVFKQKTYVQNESASIVTVDDDGTPLSCKRRVGTKRTPCGEVAIRYETREPPESLTCFYGFGMLLPGWTFTPDGNPHTISGELDVANRLYEGKYADGSVEPALFNDAEIPTAPMVYPSTPSLLVRQGSSMYHAGLFNPAFRISGVDGSVQTGFLFPDLAAGDWYRETSGPADGPIDLGSIGFNRIEADDSGETAGVTLDMSNGAPDLEFGWHLRYGTQWLKPTLPDPLRLSSVRATFRMDRFCLTVR